MKATKLLFRSIFITVLSMLFTFCSKDAPLDPTPTGTTNPITTETKESDKLDLEGDGNISIVSDNIIETETGYEFNGTLKGKNSQGEEFEIVKGEIIIEIDDDGNIENISGEGSPLLPKVGNFLCLQNDFDWNTEINSHIEYENGLTYKNKYDTNLPLDDEIKYLHFEVFDEDKDNGKIFGLRSRANDKIYDFVDFYLDPSDPSIFFSAQIPTGNPLKSLKKGKSSKKLMDKIKEKAANTGISDILDFVDDDPKFLIGLSNKGLITSKSYEFSKPENFQELYGYSGFESHSAHVYEGLENIPIPETFILRFTGDAYVHYPISQLTPLGTIKDNICWGKLLNDIELESFDYSFTGSIDMGGKGISAILGVLPKMNDVLGYDIFGKEINLDLLAATEQVSIALLDESSVLGDNSWRFGGEARTPVINDIFGEKLSKYFLQPPGLTSFVYYSLGTELDDWSVYLQGDGTLQLSIFYDMEYTSYFLLDKEGIKTRGFFNRNLGPLELTNEVSGSISPDDGLELTTLCDTNIELANGVVLYNTHLETSISTANGITQEGNIDLPFGIVDAHAQSELGPDGISFEGSFSSNLTLPNGTIVHQLGGSEMTFSISTNPEEGIALKGFIDAPGGIGTVEVEGYLKKDELYLYGAFEGNVDFNGVSLYTANGAITISSSEGFKITGAFDLPITKADLSGFVTNEGIELEGSVTRGLTIAGHAFNFTNSHVNASTKTGVQISGNMDLYFIKTDVSGSFNSNNTFSLSGTVKKKIGPWDSTIKTTVTQSGVALSGSGCLDIPIVGRQCQSLSFQPNWAAKTVRICRGSICYKF